MSDRRKVFLISPREPCGATWLINCLLELGVLTYRTGNWQQTWRSQGDRYALLPHEDILKKWLPSLSRYELFEFRSDVEVEWTHEWPSKRYSSNQVIFFTRDIKDATFSRYKRESPAIAYHEYIDYLEPRTLLNKAESCSMFLKAWSLHSSCRVFNFEDYKDDAESTLRSILQYVDIQATDTDIRNALNLSTSEKAAEAERQWNKRNQDNEINTNSEISQVVNQGGIVGRWKELKGTDKETAEKITRFYQEINDDEIGRDIYASYCSFINQHDGLDIIPIRSSAKVDTHILNNLNERALLFAREFSINKARASGLMEGDILSLLHNMADFTLNRDQIAHDNIKEEYLLIGSAVSFNYGIYCRTGKLSALLRCNPFYLLTLLLKKLSSTIRVNRVST